MEEKWKPIRGFHGWYEVSNLGRVRSPEGRVTGGRQHPHRVWRERILKQKPRIRAGSRHRYDLYVSLRKNGESRNYLVSRLVAKAFCPGFKPGLTVNHKDGNTINNRADNLECATYAENVRHSIRNGLVEVYRHCSLTFPDGTVKNYISLSDAARDIGRARTYIGNNLRRGAPIYTIDGKVVVFRDIDN